MADTDINFYFDPVCPFAWMTSKWVRKVQAQRDYTVDWRFISLRLVNSHVDYDAHFPPEYEAGHTAGLRLLRVAARTRAERGRAAVAPLYAALGAHVFDSEPVPDDAGSHGYRGTHAFVEPILAEVGLPTGLGLLRQALRCDIAAGEYVSDVYDAARLAPVVDCLQLDATRCGGYTGWLRCAAVAAAHNLQVSAHCAPALHIPVAAAVPNLRHLEYFIDHVRLEPLLLQGVPEARNGVLHVNTTAPGHGMTLNPAAEEHVVN